MIMPYDFDDILTRLDRVNEWLTSLGYLSNNRIHRYRSNLAEMVSLNREGEFEERASRISDEKIREMFWSCVESVELVSAIEPLRECLGDDLSAVPIHRAIDGPADLFLENSLNNHGRNFMFELTVGGRLARAGYRPFFGVGPDVFFNFADLRVAIQCKRPLTSAGLESNISNAIKQSAGDDRDLALIALSVSRLLSSGDPDGVITVGSPDSAHDAVRIRLEQIAETTKRYWDRKIQKAGLYLYAFVPVRWMQSSGRFKFVTIRSELLCPLPEDDLTRTLFKCLTQALGG